MNCTGKNANFGCLRLNFIYRIDSKIAFNGISYQELTELSQNITHLGSCQK